MKKAMRTNKVGSSSKRVAFEVSANPGSKVCLAGTFNNWNPQRHQLKDTRGNGKHTITLMLPKGEYEYKFVINGNWVVDPECQDWTRNSFGTLNSVKKV
ncbi:MAG: glycogen-binding domain-containing protein [Kiritimatiellia bacterium]|nr:glycogen-binding domain-containing protein [Kiritimatiellia bacterium]